MIRFPRLVVRVTNMEGHGFWLASLYLHLGTGGLISVDAYANGRMTAGTAMFNPDTNEAIGTFPTDPHDALRMILGPLDFSRTAKVLQIPALEYEPGQCAAH